MDIFDMLALVSIIVSIVSAVVSIAMIVFTVLTIIAQWKLHKALGCRWAWYIFFPVLNRIQILELMKNEDDTIEVGGKYIPYHLLSLYEYVGVAVSMVTIVLHIIPLIGSLLAIAAVVFAIGYVGRYYNARLVALLLGESPDDYQPYLKTGFLWSIFPFLPFFWLNKNM